MDDDAFDFLMSIPLTKGGGNEEADAAKGGKEVTTPPSAQPVSLLGLALKQSGGATAPVTAPSPLGTTPPRGTMPEPSSSSSFFDSRNLRHQRRKSHSTSDLAALVEERTAAVSIPVTARDKLLHSSLDGHSALSRTPESCISTSFGSLQASVVDDYMDVPPPVDAQSAVEQVFFLPREMACPFLCVSMLPVHDVEPEEKPEPFLVPLPRRSEGEQPLE